MVADKLLQSEVSHDCMNFKNAHTLKLWNTYLTCIYFKFGAYITEGYWYIKGNDIFMG